MKMKRSFTYDKRYYYNEDFPTDRKSELSEAVIVETNFALMSTKVGNRLMKV